jgi:hypothetical protein
MRTRAAEAAYAVPGLSLGLPGPIKYKSIILNNGLRKNYISTII